MRYHPRFTHRPSGPSMNGNQLAIYWDFENIHISVAKGKGIATTGYKPEEQVVELTAIMDDLQAIGPVAINRAYGNWQWMGAYKNDLLKLSIDLIQLYTTRRERQERRRHPPRPRRLPGCLSAPQSDPFRDHQR